MGTKIPWTNETWNPVTGCSPVSSGCTNCYARRMAYRLAGRYGYPKKEPFQVTLHLNKLHQPFKWKKPRMVFVDSMGDLFHEKVFGDYIATVFAVMYFADWHTYQILTKRPEKMSSWFQWLENGEIQKINSKHHQICIDCLLSHRKDMKRFTKRLSRPWPLPNVWILISAEDQGSLGRRLHHLFRSPAAVHGLSLEPLLEEVKIDEWHLKKLQWVIVGCESGPKRRPFNYDWARRIRDQCMKYDIPYFFKQAPGRDGKIIESPKLDKVIWNEFPKQLTFRPEGWK